MKKVRRKDKKKNKSLPGPANLNSAQCPFPSAQPNLHNGADGWVQLVSSLARARECLSRRLVGPSRQFRLHPNGLARVLRGWRRRNRRRRSDRHGPRCIYTEALYPSEPLETATHDLVSLCVVLPIAAADTRLSRVPPPPKPRTISPLPLFCARRNSRIRAQPHRRLFWTCGWLGPPRLLTGVPAPPRIRFAPSTGRNTVPIAGNNFPMSHRSSAFV
jgi:hypothetical protein